MEIDKNIIKLMLPLPFRLDYINCYLLRGKEGWDIIDSGLNYPPALAAWEKFFKLYNIRYTDINNIYLTHYHPDHYGTAGWLQALTGASVHIHRAENAQVEQLWKKGRLNFPLVGDMFNEHGMPATLTTEVVDNLSEILANVQPHPILSFLDGGEEIEIGLRLFKILHTPGHSDGHLCFFCEAEGLLISGDHILPHITSNIGLWPTSHSNPLEHYLTSLEMTGCLEVKKVLPGHGNVFNDCAGRVDQLIRHHRQRLVSIADMAANGSTAHKICELLFGEDLKLHELRFAMAETLAHLAYLESRGKVISKREGEVIIYRKV
ncbi:hypothetical protein DCCM_4500 [Desulfocucumis palustris]|uniref:Metallo-beta-lactamase domain-containing protein n=1 Tax=Desulfocucumis palustris TaxID=1898651 RepID=A0A2L2XGB1_9FIRM|nr:MBL fold metallo-hydrolase [Desulfocucumis palustris]GBF35377.1 hypothetical protein DCCM_4500 [Desulfocucumis palustris]